MKKMILLITIAFGILSCNSVENHEVIIKSNNDTIVEGSIYSAELYIPYNDSILPSFYILKDKETFQLPVNAEKRCANFNAVGGKGEKNYQGFVEYVNTQGKKEKQDFTIKFYVIPR